MSVHFPLHGGNSDPSELPSGLDLGMQLLRLELLGAVCRLLALGVPSAAPGPVEPMLPWTAVNFWLALLALQGLQPSVTRE